MRIGKYYYFCRRRKIKTFVRANNNIIYFKQYIIYTYYTVRGALSAARALCKRCRSEDLFCIIHAKAPGEKGCASIVVRTVAVREFSNTGKGSLSHNFTLSNRRVRFTRRLQKYTHTYDNNNNSNIPTS